MPRFNRATANFESASTACSKYFCASAGRCWFKYATPSVLRRYASAAPLVDGPGFFAAEAFSCADGALERTNIAAQQVKIEQAKINPTARRLVERVKIFHPVRVRRPGFSLRSIPVQF